MPLTLTEGQLWERVRAFQGQEFGMIERQEWRRRVLCVADKGALVERVNEDTVCGVHRKDIFAMYDFIRDHEYTSEDKDHPKLKNVQEKPLIIALLAAVLPEEIEPFTRMQGEKGLRGIRKKDC